MSPRNRMTGAGGSGLIKLIAIAVVIMIGLPYLKGCMERAPQQAVNLAASTVSSLANSLKNAADDALNDTIDGLEGTPPVTRSQCMTQDEAARLALQDARLRTKTCGDIEYGGTVFAFDKGGRTCYDYDAPQHGESMHVNIQWDPKRVNATHANPRPVGSYHSHPFGGLAEFSVAAICGYIGAADPLFTGYIASK